MMSDDKVLTFRTYLERLKEDVNNAVDRFNDLNTDQASSVCQAYGVINVFKTLQKVEVLREEISKNESYEKDKTETKLREVQASIQQLREERNRWQSDIEHDDTDVYQDAHGDSDDLDSDDILNQDIDPYDETLEARWDTTQQNQQLEIDKSGSLVERRQTLLDSDDDDSEPDSDVEYSEMELPTLLTQIQAILNEYPDDGQIIKELVQNADDAKASAIKILYDGRRLQELSQQRSRYSKFFKAPALVVYNDAEFTADDWIGIKRVYNSVKADDPLRVGRFGLGFKSVFHITDNPCIISGEKILFMNPLSKDPGKVCVTFSLKKLEQRKRLNVEECLRAYDGVFGFGRETLRSGHYPGTMFWFPLRCKESKLSTNIYSDSKIIDLFRALHSDSSRNMLFLRCIHHISLYMNVPEPTVSQPCHSTSDFFSAEQINLGKNKAFYLAEVHDVTGGSELGRKKFEQTIKDVGLDVSDSPCYFFCHVKVHTQLNLITGPSIADADWFIINYLHGGEVSEEVRTLLQDESLGYLPLGGIAAKINTHCDTVDEAGHIFCYQPLPQDKDSQTGLPVHVNAFFALTQNRRHVKWPTADQEQHQMHTDSAIHWNKVLIEEILPQAYSLFIEELQKHCVKLGNPDNLVQFIFSRIPDLEKTADRWKVLAKTALEIMQQEDLKLLFTKNAGGWWVSANDALIASFNSYPNMDSNCIDSIIRLLLKDNKNVVCAPEHVIRSKITDRNQITPTFLIHHLRKFNTYVDMEKWEKLSLLEYICHNMTTEDLQGLELIPLHNGTFISMGMVGRPIFVSRSEIISLFPGQEEAFLLNEIPETLMLYFNGIAKQGSYSIRVLEPESTADLVKRTIVSHFGDGPYVRLEHSRYTEWEAWLQKIWEHIHSEYQLQIDSFKNLPIVPVGLDNLHETGFVELHALSDTILLRSQNDGSLLSDNICQAFKLLSVVILTRKPEWIQQDLSQYFYDASCSSILKLLEHVSVQDVKKLNQELSREAKMALSEFLVNSLSTVTPNARRNLQQLKIFKQYMSINSETVIVSVEENCQIYYSDTFPVDFPKPVLLLSKNESIFVEKLGGKVLKEEDMIMQTFENFQQYSVSSQKVFILWLLSNGHWRKYNRTLKYLQDFEYLLADDGNMYAPKDLFDPTNAKVKTLFMHESVFPVDEDYLTDECLLALRKFGLKGETQITVSDIERTCSYIDQRSEESNTDTVMKATAVIEVLEDRPEFLNQCSFERFTFIPVFKERPQTYPCHILYKSEISSSVVRPSEITSLDHVNLVGSIIPVVDCKQFPCVSKHFQWQHLPKVSIIVQHLHNLTTCYENRYKPAVLSALLQLYTVLDTKVDFAETKRSLEKEFPDKSFVWYGDGFVKPDVIFVEVDKSDIDLKPYLRPLPSELVQFRDFFKKLGCFESIDVKACLHVLGCLQKESEEKSHQISPSSVRNLSVTILNKLKSDDMDTVLSLEGQIYIPIETDDDQVQFKFANQCVYCDADWLKDEIEDDDEEEMIFAHKDIPVSTATALGLPSLSQTVFADSDAMEEWGQDEPLTRRLRNILEEGYVDGFSVPKELFQNADDAGASKMWIMYDERENEDCRKNLLNAGMAEWQGPALWVYNDAEFTEKDFENITKLSGATKEFDPCTIGKFGLGFCAVYNLTDVPSLISGENIVIFDPHMKYLGKAIPGKSPGLKINVNKMKTSALSKKVRNQFRPAVNVFGCEATTNEDFYFRGTLFRFPLRRNNTSEISDIRYTSDRVQNLLKMVYDTAANLLLFNLHVNEIKVFHLPNGGNPLNPTLLFETSKHIEYTSTAQIQKNSVLMEAVVRKQKNELGSKQLQMVARVNISSKRPNSTKIDTSWLVSWATGVKDETLRLMVQEEGAVPIAAVAVPYEHVNQDKRPISLDDLPDGFYKTGHFFVFLPIPIDHGYPFHINATFAVSSDRRQLRKLTGDDNETKFENWNKCLLGDCVIEALMYLLENMKHLNISPTYDHYDIWPLPQSDNMKDELRICFYKNVFQKFHCQIFSNAGKWFDISKCKFIEPSLKKHEVFGKYSVDLFKQFCGNENIVNLSQPYYDQLMQANRDIVQSQTISTKRFVLEILLSNLSVLSATLPKDVRDKYIKFAIHMKDSDINGTLKNIQCIPVKPNGDLHYIKDIIEYGSKVACLFDEKDGRFATEEFMDGETCKLLRCLGMQHDALTDEDILDRVKSVSDLNEDCSYCAVERCNQVLKYLDGNMKSYNVLIQQLKHQPFLPVAYKPDAWFDKEQDELADYKHCDRHSNKTLIKCPIDVVDMKSQVCPGDPGKYRCRGTISPADVISHDLAKLTGSVSPLVLCDTIPDLARLFGWHEQPKLETVIQHFVNIVDRYEACLKSTFLPMVITIYKFLEDKCEFIEVRNRFQTLFEGRSNRYIWSGDEFMAPEHIYINRQVDDIDMHPFIKALPQELDDLKTFFSKLGCSDRIDSKVYISVLEQLKIDSEDTQSGMSPSSLRGLAVTILNKLKHEFSDVRADPKVKIYIPVTTTDESLAAFALLEQCVYCDSNWRMDQETLDEEDRNIQLVHSDIPKSTLEAFEIPSLTQKMFSDSDAMEEWGQDEPLTRRLRNILQEGYVDGFSVPKELFQNADDAGASKMWIMYDERENENCRKNLLNAGMAEWQGPALWVYNDAEFTEKDFENITKLSGATKESDPCTIGKFGLGFCSVYNLTDVPSLISGENIVIFDPHMKYLGKALPGRSPGMKINVRKMTYETFAKKVCNQFKPAENVFGCELFLRKKTYFPGTLFRFPLRIRPSDISDEVYSDKEMKDLIQITAECAANMLLFNMNVEEFKIFHLPKNEQQPQNAKLIFEASKAVSPIYPVGSVKIPVLKEASIRKRNKELNSKQLQIVNEVHISRTHYNSSLSADSSDTVWLVSWATGIEEKTINMSNEQEGALPLGAVALPLNRSHNVVPLQLADLPNGFYKKGHFYFFLPLPLDHMFPFHVNCPFIVSSDRRSFRVTTDEDTHARFRDWNSALLGDAVVEAIMLLFKALQSFSIPPSFKVYDIWPLPTSDALSNTMVVQFYLKMVSCDSHKVFKVNDTWLSILQCKFLHPDLREKSTIGSFAFEILANKIEYDTAVDIPNQIYSQMFEADVSVMNNRTIGIEEFIKNFFLPNIHDFKETELRDKLTRFAIELHHSDVDSQLQEICCIPTKPHGQLKRPIDTVERNSTIALLFDENDEHFVTEEFQDEAMRRRLKELGMIEDILNDNDLFGRVQSIIKLNEVCPECSLERCFYLLVYLENNLDNHRNVIDEIQNQSFLPVLQYQTSDGERGQNTTSCSNHTTERPIQKQIPVSFNIVQYETKLFQKEEKRIKQCKRVLLSPCDVHSAVHSSTVGSVKAVIDCAQLERLSGHFGWNSVPKLETLVDHFHNIVQCYDVTNKHIMLPMVKDVYQLLSEEEDLEEVKYAIQQRFADLYHAYIWFGDGFVDPQRIFVDQRSNDIDLSPYLRPLPSELSEFKEFFKILGCFGSIDFDAYLNILDMIKNECGYDDENLTVPSMRRIAVSIINELKDNYLENVIESNRLIYFPVHTADNSFSMKAANECVFCDAQWLNDVDLFDDEDELKFVHSDVSNSTAEALGVSSLSDKVFSNAEAMEEWGQEEPLTTRLKHILKEGYVDGFSVPKELFQNADDAGATKLLIMYDKRENGDARHNLLCEGMADWQGPALWVYNDAEFREDDFRNITKLCGATKENDSCKIGKFGLGFCSVYNLTDVPSFISGDSIVVFDPHMKHLGKAMPGKSPGLRINLAQIKNKTMISKVNAQFKPYENVFGCRLISEEKSHFHGTLFRFPLRNQPSEISDNSYSESDMERFLDKTMESAANLFLFNMNIEELKLYVLEKDEQNPSNGKLIFKVNKRVQSVSQSITGLSLLQEVSQRKKKGLLRQNQLKALQKVSIERTSVNENPETLSTEWLVSWATGIEDGTMDMTDREEGAVPLGGVAVPYQNEHGEVNPISLQDLPDGFYKTGHFFFFLPMPVEHSFPFHVNGPFAVSSDRRKLRAMSDDDFDSKFEKWNVCLLGDCLVQALVHVLQMMPELTPSAKYLFYSYWPLAESKMISALPEKFYQKIVQSSELKIFNSFGNWIDIFECIFLEPELRCNELVGRPAFNVLAEFAEGNKAIDIPQCYYEFLMKANSDVIQSKTVSTNTLVCLYFLSNIGNLQECITSSERDELTRFSLCLRSREVDISLKETMCIPTKPHGTLRHINDLVDKTSLFAPLFDDTDCRFPTDQYEKEEIYNRLKELGMLSVSLPEQILLEKAHSISTLGESCFQCAVERSAHLLVYLKQAHLNEQTLACLQQTQFLPVKYKPDDWPSVWHTQDVETVVPVETCGKHDCFSDKVGHFMQPVEMFNHKWQNLVGCVKPIVDVQTISHVDETLFFSLGVKHVLRHDVTSAEIVIAHLTEISKTTVLSDTARSLVTEIMKNIYSYLNEECDNESIKKLVYEKLYKSQVIWVGGVFTSSEKVALKEKRQTPPYLYTLIGNPLSQCTKLCKTLNISDYFEPKQIVQVLYELQETYGNQALSDEDLDNCILLLQMLSLSMKIKHISMHELFDDKIKAIYAPDEKKVLQPTSVMCFNDFDAIAKSDTMIYVHETISPKIAKAFGVKPKVLQNLEDISDDIEDFYQEEPLTTRIKGLLEGYPCDSSVFKELLQNADDAGASEVHIIFDTTTHGSKNIFNQRFKALQGPALVVFNNKEFTSDDLRGIQKLGAGSKQEDPSKTGRYGVGFNAVYNITDVPSFLTFGSKVENGETLCMFDPNAEYIPNVTRAKPGKRYKNTKSIHDHHGDVLSGYHIEVFKEYDAGTIFRLPLRSEIMAKTSDISNETVSPEQITDMLMQFQKELGQMLIFMKKVQKVSVSSYSRNKIVEEYSIDIRMSTDDERKRNDFFQYFQDKCKTNKSAILEVEQKRVDYCLCLTENKEPIAMYSVVQVFGCENPQLVPGIVKANVQNGNIGLLPYGGVALAYTCKKKIDLCTNSAKAFCFLPLPIDTGLPVNVNGYFALSDEKRRSIWYANGGECYKTQWNIFLIKDIITPAYIDLLERMKCALFGEKSPNLKQLTHRLNIYFEMFPCFISDSDRYWKMLADSVFFSLVSNNICFLPITKQDTKRGKGRGKHVTWTSLYVPYCHFPAYAEVKCQVDTERRTEYHVAKSLSNPYENMNEVLKNLGLRIVNVPTQIETYLKQSNVPLPHLDAVDLIDFLCSTSGNFADRCDLKTDVPVKNTQIESLENCKQLLKFCEYSKHLYCNFRQFPLLVSQQGNLKSTATVPFMYCTYFSDFFPNEQDSFLHESIQIMFKPQYTSGALKPFSLQDFVMLLQRSELHHLANECVTDWSRQDPTDAWISKVWRFFWHEFSEYSCPTIGEKKQKQREYFDKNAEIVKNISLLPVIVHDSGASTRIDLLAVSKIDTVIDLNSFIGKTLHGAIRKMLFSELDLECFKKCKKYGDKLLEQIPQFEYPMKVLVCLVENRMKVCEAQISIEESLCILEYLFQHLDRTSLKENITLVRQLPLFVTHDCRRVDLASFNSVVVAPHEMPNKGLEFLTHQTEVVLLQSNNVHEMCKEFLSFQNLPVAELYLKYVFPNQQKMDTAAFYLHIEFIANLYAKHDFSEIEQINLFSVLSKMSFIETYPGHFCKVSDLFSYGTEVFKTFCSETEFLPKRFRTKYSRFFIKLGLKCNMSVALFERFAEELSRSHAINEDVEQKSKLLGSTLMNMPSDFFNESNLSCFSVMEFLLPEDIENGLLKLCNQHSRKKLICYANSVIPGKRYVCWTTSVTVPNYAKPKQNDHYNIICQKLRIATQPQVEDFVKHCELVCKSVVKKISLNKKVEWTMLKKVMIAIYKQFETFRDTGLIKSSHTESLKDTPVILFPNAKMMYTADSVVIECHTDEKIPPYLDRCPSEFGPYQKVFLLLGAARNPSIQTYAMVLKKIKSKNGDKEMLPDDLHRTKAAVCNLVECLAKHPVGQSVECADLFLPDSCNRMENARALILCNNNYIRKRLGHRLPLRFFIGFEKLGIKEDTGLYEFMKLSEEVRPQLLTDVIGEEVVLDSIRIQDNNVSAGLEHFIRSDVFISGILRLAKHALTVSKIKWTDEKETMCISEMKRVRVRNVLGMKTILIQKQDKKKVDGTTESKSFHMEETPSAVTVFIESQSAKLWCTDFKNEFALHVNKLFGSCFKERNFILLVTLIDSKDHPESISDLLDKQHIDPYSLKQEMYHPEFPKPGEFVPEKYHQYLDNDNGIIHMHDYRYVAYAVEDPLVEDLSDEAPVYVYAEIKRKLESESSVPLLQYYEVDIGEEQLVKVPAFKLYKFIRKEKQGSAVCVSEAEPGDEFETINASATDSHTGRRNKTMKEVRKEIRETLEDAWKKDKKDRRHVVLRLIKEWHPDKNMDNVDFCTKVSQYIQQCLRILEEGRKLSHDESDDEDRDSQPGANWGSSGYWDTFFDGFERRQRRRGNRHPSDFDFDFTSETPFSYPREARRWQQQARSDLESAQECEEMHPSPAFNWICYKCHQAAEKSLTAAWYASDANHVRLIKHSHDLTDIANGLSSRIIELARQLTHTTGSARRMRYPSEYLYQRIPATEYSQTEACESCRLAAKLLQEVASRYSLS